jgi:hypothetical protein
LGALALGSTLEILVGGHATSRHCWSHRARVGTHHVLRDASRAHQGFGSDNDDDYRFDDDQPTYFDAKFAHELRIHHLAPYPALRER